MNDLFQYPISFWLSLAVLIAVAVNGWKKRHRGWGFPCMAMCATVIAWYHGDGIYNGYSDSYVAIFSPNILNDAWCEILIFSVAFGVFCSYLPDWINQKLAERTSQIELLRTSEQSLGKFQSAIAETAYAVAMVWLILFGIGLWRSGWDVVGCVAPYLGQNTARSIWGRGQVAVSWYDSIATIIAQLLEVCAAFFGICAATLKNGNARYIMQLLMGISWPAFFFDRTRYVMLLVLLPGLLAYVFFRLRGRQILQISVLIIAFLSVDIWFKFVIVNRAENNIAEAFASGAMFENTDLEKAKHNGFNMFEELCWINHFLDTGEFNPSWGQLYFANLVNFIPRSLWANKPTMGLDYAIARGQGGDSQTGVSATMAVGMVGSGVVNFGKWLGPVGAALLMTLWCAFLARLDLSGDDFGRLLVYCIGCISIFLFGRDITILIAYPTLFGYGLLLVWRKLAPVSNR